MGWQAASAVQQLLPSLEGSFTSTRYTCAAVGACRRGHDQAKQDMSSLRTFEYVEMQQRVQVRAPGPSPAHTYSSWASNSSAISAKTWV